MEVLLMNCVRVFELQYGDQFDQFALIRVQRPLGVKTTPIHRGRRRGPRQAGQICCSLRFNRGISWRKVAPITSASFSRQYVAPRQTWPCAERAIRAGPRQEFRRGISELLRCADTLHSALITPPCVVQCFHILVLAKTWVGDCYNGERGIAIEGTRNADTSCLNSQM